MSVPDRRLLTDAVIAAVASATGKPCGDHRAPVGVDPPYTIVWSIPGGRYWGPWLSAPDSCADFVVQVDSVGRQRAQADALAAQVRDLMLDRSGSGALAVITPPPGWRIADRSADGGPPGVDVGGDSPHYVFSVPERFVLRVVPA